MVISYIDSFLDKHQDPKVENFKLVSSINYLIWPAVFYVLLVKFIGPKLMEGRKPYKLRTVLILYNLFQVILSTYMFVEGSLATYLNKYSWQCEPLDTSKSADAIRVANVAWMYAFAKYTELLDTIFFVMRKKNSQLSFLHLFHHLTMLIMVWFGVKLAPSGHAGFLGCLNSFVHIVMYFYYLLSALGPQMQKYLQWKRYITILQLVQFALVFYHSAQALFNGCDYPRPILLLIMAQASFFFCLFAKFYYRVYITKHKIH